MKKAKLRPLLFTTTS